MRWLGVCRPIFCRREDILGQKRIGSTEAVIAWGIVVKYSFPKELPGTVGFRPLDTSQRDATAGSGDEGGGMFRAFSVFFPEHYIRPHQLFGPFSP